jgi:hypothetical protein
VHIMFVLKGKDQHKNIYDCCSNNYDVTMELEMVIAWLLYRMHRLI